MQIADLFVRVRGDTTDVATQLRGVSRGLESVEAASGKASRGMGIAHLSTGKLRQELVTLVRQATGTAPVVAQLGTVVGEFALGSTMVLGVTAGIAAIAFAYNKLTEGARKAKKEQDDLSESLEKTIALKALGPGGETVAQVASERQRAGELQIQIDTLQKALIAKPREGESPMMAQHRTAANAITEQKINDLYIERQSLLNHIASGESIIQGIVNEIKRSTEGTAPKVKEITAAFGELREMADKVNAEQQKDNRDWWKNYIEKTGEAAEVTGQLEDHLIAVLSKGTPLENLPGFGTAAGKPIDIDVAGLVKPMVDQLKADKEAADRHKDELKEAIWGSALAGANTIVSALNLGGGGKGSGLGGAIGSAAGFALGFAGKIGFGLGGPIGGAIGSLVGQIGGSLLGGLFDHNKKSVDANTRATDRNTAMMALLLNAPSGFKVAADRYDATDVRRLGNANRRWASRGGVPILTVGT